MQRLTKKVLIRLVSIILLGVIAMLLMSCSDNSIVITEEAKIDQVKSEIKKHFNPGEDTTRLIDQFVGKNLLEISLEDIDGNNIKLSELSSNENEFILEFMAPWCPACINIVEDLKEINKDIKVINVALGANNFEEINEFKDTSNSDLEYFLTNNDTAELYNIMYIPTAFYIKDNIIWGVFDNLNNQSVDAVRKIVEGV